MYNRCPGADPLRCTPLCQLVLASDLWRDPLLKINFNLCLPHLSPPKNLRWHYQPLTEMCLLFLWFLQEAPRDSKGNYIQRELGPQR